jgi:succinyl-diaminopimelate desuccinylase
MMPGALTIGGSGSDARRTRHLDAVMTSPALSAAFLIEVLRSLIAIESVNPGTSEQAVVDRIGKWLGSTSARLARTEFAPGRPSLAAVIEGTERSPALVLNGHTDTVPIGDVASWTMDPLGGEVVDGFLYGRGACDMKAGLAVEIAMAHFFSDLPPLQGSLVLHFAAGEERGEPGTLSMLEAGFSGDYGISLEPTDLKIAVASRGAARFVIRIKGRASHSGRPELGLNPLWPLRQVLDMVSQYHEELASRSHPLLPPPCCTPTMVMSGMNDNSVPGLCEVWIDRRLLPGESSEAELRELSARLSPIASENEGYEFEITPTLAAEAAEVDADSWLVTAIEDAMGDITGRSSEKWGAPYGSDLRHLVNDAKMEAVMFGPGSIDACHQPDEKVPIRQLEEAARIVALVALTIADLS